MRLAAVDSGYRLVMEIDTATPDDPRPERDPEARHEGQPDPDSPGATIDDPVVAEPNEPG